MKVPIVSIDNKLAKYKDMPLFQDKIDQTNEILRTVGLPKIPVSKTKSKTKTATA